MPRKDLYAETTVVSAGFLDHGVHKVFEIVWLGSQFGYVEPLFRSTHIACVRGKASKPIRTAAAFGQNDDGFHDGSQFYSNRPLTLCKPAMANKFV
jgi:hypothetical protein